MAPSMERWTAIVAEPECRSGGNQMGIKEGKRRLVLACLLVIFLSSCLPAQKVALSKSGDCPPTRKFQRVIVDGRFVIPADQRISVNGGYESNHPQAQFTFSAAQGAKSKFTANVIWANQGLNGPEKANRTELTGSGDQRVWIIYDKQGREIKANDMVKITGLIVDACVVRVDKIEKL
jgi:hypothetical protein